MKKIQAKRYRKPGKGRTLRREGRASPAAAAPAQFAKYRVMVDADGREHFAVPLMGPKHAPGKPYLIAHFTLPPPREREALIEALARIIARAALEEVLKKSCTD